MLIGGGRAGVIVIAVSSRLVVSHLGSAVLATGRREMAGSLACDVPSDDGWMDGRVAVVAVETERGMEGRNVTKHSRYVLFVRFGGFGHWEQRWGLRLPFAAST